MKSVISLVGTTFIILFSTLCNASFALANDIVDASGVTGGLIVHVGCGDGVLTARLLINDRFLVQGIDTDSKTIEAARHRFAAAGISGRVAASLFDGKRMPFKSNLVNLVVVTNSFDVPDAELLRILAPRGVALIQTVARPNATDGMTIDGTAFRKLVKPWPNDIDEWTHYLHDPGNNAVANDTVINAPRGMQWLAGPTWTRSHHKLNSISSVVTAKGRLFCILDESTAANINVPGQWSLICRDAFSGVLLWKKPMESWAWHLIRFRSGPAQVTRLLVAAGDRVFAPLGLNAPVSAIDADTGKTLATYDDTQAAEEIVVIGDTLLVLKGAGVAAQTIMHEAFRGRPASSTSKTIVAIDIPTGRTRWTWTDPTVAVQPETLAADAKRVYAQVDQGVVCLDLESGKEAWRYSGNKQSKSNAKARKRAVPNFGRSVLVVAEDVVLALLSDKLTALSAVDGNRLWDCWGGGGFHAPTDVFVINGLVWHGEHISDSVAPPAAMDFSEGRDLHTGEVKVTNHIAVDLQSAGHHHRCYREKATCRFIMTSKRGIEMMDLVGDQNSRNNWLRGTCQYGILPANGLIYTPSHSCGCYMESKLRGFWSLSPESAVPSSAEKLPMDRRLEKGVTAADEPNAAGDDDWPAYRHDAMRSSIAATTISANLKPAWKTALGPGLTQPVIAGGKVIVAVRDRNTVIALNESDGVIAWTHIAGGRIDSSPTLNQGNVYFGSADGCVTCLRLSDGGLVWRFFAAPADTRVVSYDRVESVWPVHGSVLILNGVLYCSAGRSTWLDGGIAMYGLDPVTGNVLYQNQFVSKHPVFQKGKSDAREEQNKRIDQNVTDYKTFLESDKSDAFSMAGGAISDILVSDGMDVFLHHVRFNTSLEKQAVQARHLFSTSSLIDDTESHRSHWVLGTGDFSRIPVAYSWIVNRPGRKMPTIAVPTGIQMLFDDHHVWGVRRQGDSNGKYTLYRRQNRPFDPNEKFLPDFRVLTATELPKDEWSLDLPVRTRGMLKAGDKLYLAVAPIEIPENDPNAAYEGRTRGAIWMCSTEDGKKLAEYPIEHPAVWDGLSAANGKLFVSTMDGTVRCLAANQ